MKKRDCSKCNLSMAITQQNLFIVLRVKVTPDDFNSNSTPDLTIPASCAGYPVVWTGSGQQSVAPLADKMLSNMSDLICFTWCEAAQDSRRWKIWEQHRQHIIRIHAQKQKVKEDWTGGGLTTTLTQADIFHQQASKLCMFYMRSCKFIKKKTKMKALTISPLTNVMHLSTSVPNLQ